MDNANGSELHAAHFGPPSPAASGSPMMGGYGGVIVYPTMGYDPMGSPVPGSPTAHAAMMYSQHAFAAAYGGYGHQMWSQPAADPSMGGAQPYMAGAAAGSYGYGYGQYGGASGTGAFLARPGGAGAAAADQMPRPAGGSLSRQGSGNVGTAMTMAAGPFSQPQYAYAAGMQAHQPYMAVAPMPGTRTAGAYHSASGAEPSAMPIYGMGAPMPMYAAVPTAAPMLVTSGRPQMSNSGLPTVAAPPPPRGGHSDAPPRPSRMGFGRGSNLGGGRGGNGGSAPGSAPGLSNLGPTAAAAASAAAAAAAAAAARLPPPPPPAGAIPKQSPLKPNNASRGSDHGASASSAAAAALLETATAATAAVPVAASAPGPQATAGEAKPRTGSGGGSVASGSQPAGGGGGGGLNARQRRTLRRAKERAVKSLVTAGWPLPNLAAAKAAVAAAEAAESAAASACSSTGGASSATTDGAADSVLSAYLDDVDVPAIIAKLAQQKEGGEAVDDGLVRDLQIVQEMLANLKKGVSEGGATTVSLESVGSYGGFGAPGGHARRNSTGGNSWSSRDGGHGYSHHHGSVRRGSYSGGGGAASAAGARAAMSQPSSLRASPMKPFFVSGPPQLLPPGIDAGLPIKRNSFDARLGKALSVPHSAMPNVHVHA